MNARAGMRPAAAAVAAAAVTLAACWATYALFLERRPGAVGVDNAVQELATMVREGRFEDLSARLAPDFVFSTPTPLSKAVALSTARTLVSERRFFPYVAHVEAVPDRDDRWNLVAYGVYASSDPSQYRRAPVTAFRVEALVEVRDDEVVVLSARL